MTGYDLEIALHRRDGVHWAVELRFDDPSTETENALVPQSALAVTFDFDKLDELAHQDMDEYGRAWAGACSRATSTALSAKPAPLRSERPAAARSACFIGPSAPSCTPCVGDDARPRDRRSPADRRVRALLRGTSRSLDWRSAGARPKSNTRALVVVANPSGLADYESDDRRLAPIDVAGEVERARSGLRTVPSPCWPARRTVTTR